MNVTETEDPADETVVPSGALAVALAVVESMHGRQHTVDDELDPVITDALGEWGPAVMADAFLLLIGVGVNALGTSPEDPDLVYSLISTPVARLRRIDTPAVPQDALPLVAAVMTAAVLGQDCCNTRRTLGPPRAGEPLIWCYTLWLLIELLDSVQGEGTFAKIVTMILASEPDDETDH
jgi:hypothetical protein